MLEHDNNKITRLLSAREVALYLGVTADTVKAWIRTKGLPAVQLNKREYRIDPIDLEQWLDRGTQREENSFGS
jgi:excisionase family DNA binding protein